jgi:predicted TIM-barrel fold metal-dependent hydrolase
VETMMISADDHIDLGYLPKDIWTARLPKSLGDRAPHVEERGEQGEYWVCDGQPWGDWRGGTWFARKNRPIVALDRGGVADLHTLRPTTAELRLADMDRDGVEASVMFPPIFGMTFKDRDLMIACVQVYNDWAADFAKASPMRILPVAQMFPDDPEASAREVVRAAKLGLRQVNFLVGTVNHEMYMPSWEPFWAAAEETGMVVSYHVGGNGGDLTGTPPTRANVTADAPRPAFGMGLGNGSTTFFQPFVNLFTYGILERHPNIRFVLAESGTGWIPFVVQEMDYRYEQALERNPASRPLKEMPSEVFRRQVWATYQQDLVGLSLVDFFGEGHMMWASDYPHPDSTWPNSRKIVEKETAKLQPEIKQQIIRENAKRFYAL